MQGQKNYRDQQGQRERSDLQDQREQQIQEIQQDKEEQNQYNTIALRKLGVCDFKTSFQAMQSFTAQRDSETVDELWFLQHPPVFTQGLAGKAEHILRAGEIPVVQTDRGGQVTYHGPGQLMVYCLIDIKRRNFGIRQFVTLLEAAMISFLAEYQIPAEARLEAPGVYVAGAKIASLGLRIRKGASYHGLSFNVDMDMEPFSRINPCGVKNLKLTQLRDLINPPSFDVLIQQLSLHVARHLGYNKIVHVIC